MAMSHEEDLAEGLRYIGKPVDGMAVEMSFETEEQRETLHARNVAHLEAYVRASTAHAQHVPDCDAAPLCCGPAVGVALLFRTTLQHGYSDTLLHSAIRMLGQRDAEIVDLRAQLMGMDADLVDARGNLADTERQLFDAQARLAACDTMLADAVPPVMPVDES